MINYHYISPEFLTGYAPVSARTIAFTSQENAEGDDHGHDQSTDEYKNLASKISIGPFALFVPFIAGEERSNIQHCAQPILQSLWLQLSNLFLSSHLRWGAEEYARELVLEHLGAFL